MTGTFRYIFGPVASRRMGLSLGVDIIPRFTCTHNCVYCEVGRMSNQTLRRRDYVPVEDILAEVKIALEQHPTLDYITFSGSGEPTLHASLGRLIREIKQMTLVPIAVITNGALLYREPVRRDLMQADLVMPSLDAVTQEVFDKINRSPMKVSRILQGLRLFAEEFPGEIWLEILFVKGLNDGDEEVNQLAQVIQSLNLARIQINTVVRPPAESDAYPLTYQELERIQQTIGAPAEIVASFSHSADTKTSSDPEEALLELLERRGCTFDEMAKGLQIPSHDLEPLLADLLAQQTIQQIEHHGAIYYRRIME